MLSISDCSMLARRADIPGREHGVALITVLLVVALLTAIVSRLSLSNELWLRQVESGAAEARADQAGRALQQWIMMILEQDSNAFDARTDLWSQPLSSPIPTGHGSVQGSLEDMQGRFNLNNLVDEEGDLNAAAVEQFERLLVILELNPGLSQAVVDWIDADGHRAGPWGAEDGYYLGLEPPYLAANRGFDDAAELRLIRGADQNAWSRLEPHITALPRPTKINVNTAGPEVLAAVITDWGEPRTAMVEAERWAGETDRNPVTDIEDFVERALSNEDGAVPPALTNRTDYFMAHTQLSFGNVVYRVATLYERSQGKTDILRHRRVLY